MSERSRRHASCYWITSKRYFGFVVVLLAVIVLTWSPAKAAEGGDTKSTGGLTVYLGVVPAEITKGSGPHLAERPMHGGAPKGQHEHHVVVAVYDSASNIRITDATVTAKISGLGTLGSSENTRAHDNRQLDHSGHYRGVFRIVDPAAPRGEDFRYRLFVQDINLFFG